MAGVKVSWKGRFLVREEPSGAPAEAKRKAGAHTGSPAQPKKPRKSPVSVRPGGGGRLQGAAERRVAPRRATDAKSPSDGRPSPASPPP